MTHLTPEQAARHARTVESDRKLYGPYTPAEIAARAESLREPRKRSTLSRRALGWQGRRVEDARLLRSIGEAYRADPRAYKGD